MAYVDENGLILIDDVEVAEDIAKLKTTMDLFDEALSSINQIISINSGFKGDTAQALDEATAEMVKRVTAQKEEIEEAIRYINQVVERYKTIDANMRDQINSTLTEERYNHG